MFKAAYSNSVHVALCCDEHYAPFAAVVMLSAIASAKSPEDLCFHLVVNQVAPGTQLRIEREVKSRGAMICVYEAENGALFDGLPTGRFGPAVYQRILLGECLPDDISRVIYLDGDTLVRQDLGLLWATDLCGHMLAAVEDLSRSACKILGVSRFEYFNSGVLLMDLEAWRAERIHWKIAEYAEENAHKLRYVDQCSLNAVLAGRWLRLHPRWNVQTGIYKTLRRYVEGSGYSRTELEQALAWPAVIHYTGKKGASPS